MSVLRLQGLLVVAAGALCACSSSTPTGQASVEFRLAAPLCGGGTPFGLTFLIDSAQVGTDSLHDGSTSAAFTTTAGNHRLSAFVSNHAAGTPFALDTAVVLAADSVFVQTVGLYCS